MTACTTAEPALRLTNVCRSFGSVAAVDSVSLEINRHQVVGLVGENGAGKSTLLKILAGIERPDSGRFEVNGTAAEFKGPEDAFKVGIGAVHQEQSLFTNLTVAENIELHIPAGRGGVNRLGLYRWSRLNRDAAKTLDKIGIKLNPKTRVGDLSFVERQMVEIARAIRFDPALSDSPLIILDEPTAVLEHEETAVLEREIKNLRPIGSVIYVAHRLDEVMRICDRTVVMRNGRIVADRSTGEFTEDELFRLMVGRASGGVKRRRSPISTSAEPALQVRELTSRGSYRDVSFAAYAGRIVALIGANGSGCEALARTVFGAEKHDSGAIEVNGRRVSRWSIARAVEAGLGYVPSERKVEGMIGGLSAARNIAIVHPGEAATGPVLRPRRRARLAQFWFDRLDVRPNDVSQELERFSGGNQQKVVLAKWLNSPNMKVLILDHPLRGLDPGAAQTVNDQITRACEDGAAAVLIPDTIEEALERADEIIVMRDGEISAYHDLRVEDDVSVRVVLEEMV